jgi:ubiquinone/menaquinone biosynthesis C-methylase UbiE
VSALNWREIRQRLYLLAYRLLYDRRIETNLLNKWLENRSVARVADVACGKGLIGVLLARNGCDVYGVDLDRNSVRFANAIKASLSCEFQVGHAERLPYRSEAFDLLICNCALEHFHDDGKALSEMSRILRVGGKLFLTVDSFSCRNSDENVKRIHATKFQVVNYYSLPEISHKLALSSFQIERHRHYIRSRLSRAFYDFLVRRSSVWWEDVISLIAFPLLYPLVVLTDSLSSELGGYHLAIMAVKCDAADTGAPTGVGSIRGLTVKDHLS